MIFLDTSAIYALASTADPNHASAKKTFSLILDSRDVIVTHNYVMVESFALLQARLGLRSALAFARDSQWLEIEWVDAEMHSAAVSRWAAGKRDVSLVDHVSFVLMQRRRIEYAFAFDDDFKEAGFRLYQRG